MARRQRETGIVKAWNTDRGFGFIERAASSDLFLHIKAFPRGAGDPYVGEKISFEVELQSDGKPRAARASREGATYQPPVRPTSPLIGALAIVAFSAIFVLVHLTWGPLAVWIPVLYLGMSGITFAAYAIDKSAARLRQRRVAETSLVLLGIAGGWPGAVVAQQVLRHKTAKQSFRAVFWVSVLLNVVAFVALSAPGVVPALVSVIGG